MNVFRLMLGAALASTLVIGCAAETASTPAEAEQASAEALSYSSIVGSYESAEGPVFSINFTSKAAQTLGGGVKGHAFTATIDNGVRCIKAPCPSTSDVSGIYVVSGKTLTLTSYDKPAAFFLNVIGDYKITQGKDGIQIDKKDHTVSEALSRVHGQPCGDAVCGEGTVCCNPLTNTCVKPGMVCTL
jgi:hypothetical protein